MRIDENQKSLYFPLENVESNIVGYRKITNSNKNEVVSDINSGGLVTARTSTKSKDTAVIVPNIEDFLVLLNAKISYSVVCLPNELTSLPQYYLPSLERFKKLILWFGHENKAWDAARHFARKLEEKRCLLVR